MPNILNYNQLLSATQNLCVDSGSSDFLNIFPQAIQYCESMAYRSLDFLGTRGTDNNTLTVNGTRTITLPVDISVVEGISVLTPAGTKPPTAKRTPLERLSQDTMDFIYPSDTVTAVPTNYSLLSDTIVSLGNVPDNGYYLEITGTLEPAPMSASNQTTILGNLFPDLLLSGCMVFLSAWQRDFGGSFSPGDANTWQTAYDSQLKTAIEFIQRQKSQDPGWTPLSPTPLATPRTG